MKVITCKCEAGPYTFAAVMQARNRIIAAGLSGLFLAIIFASLFAQAPPDSYAGVGYSHFLTPAEHQPSEFLALPEYDNEECNPRPSADVTFDGLKDFHSSIFNAAFTSILKVRNATFPVQPLFLLNNVFLI